MIINNKVNLADFSHLKVGGIAKKLYRPEKIEDLVWLTNNLTGYYVLSGGSNILINNKVEFENVIFMGDYKKEELFIADDQTITCSSGVDIQKLLKFANEKGFGGAEYLITLPALVGGIVAMNAGGGTHENSISQYIKSVEVVREGEIALLEKAQCNFSHRYSVFLNHNWIISKINFNFMKIPTIDGQRRMNEKIKFTKEKQDISKPNLGSVFNQSNTTIMRILRYTSKKKEGLYYSKLGRNWIVNGGKGTFSEAKYLIKKTETIHRIFRKDCKLEWRIWDEKVNS